MKNQTKVIFENFISLVGVQFANYFLQLITFPYLIRALGVAGFGLYSFVFAFTQYFLVITDYGFNLTATRQISIARDDKKLLSEIFSSVFIIKAGLFIISLIIIAVIVTLIPKFRNDGNIFLVGTIGVLGNFIFPIWYYQGIEKTKYIALFNACARLLTTAGIFCFVHEPHDLLRAVTIQSSGVLLSGCISLVMMARFWPVRIVLPARESIKKALRDGWNVFVTLLSATLVNNTNIFILGLLATNQQVGYFSIADKIVRVFHNMVSPLSVAIFPHMSKLFDESREKAVHFLRKIILYGGAAFLCASIFLVVFSGLLVRVFVGESSSHVQTLILILSVLPSSIFLDNMYGQQVLINIGCSREFMKGILFPGICSLALSFIIVPALKDLGTAILFVSSQLTIMILMISFVRRRGIFLIKENYL